MIGRRRRGSSVRGVVAAIVLLAAAVLTSTFAQAQPGGGSTDPPNVVVILTDDQRLPGTLEVMPNMRRRFRSQGTDFPQATANTPQCCPARASIMTGQYAHNHSVLTNNDATNLDQNKTIQRYLKDAGYSTAMFGKFLNDWNLSVNPQFWDQWAIFNNGSYVNYQANEQGTLKTVTQYATSYVSDKAVQFIEDRESDDARPWFLYVNPTAPHAPNTPESKYASATMPPFAPTPGNDETDRSDKPPHVQAEVADMNLVLNQRIQQLRTLRSVDDMVGRLFSTLQNNGEMKNTLAFFVSDNGWLWGEHGVARKQHPYTESISVPFLMRWPGEVTAGAIDRRLVSLHDLAPTIMDASNVTPGHVMDGRSLFDESQSRDRMLLEFWRPPIIEGVPTWASIRTKDFQYIEYYGTDNQTVTFREYYDLNADPWQLTNLLGDGNPGNDPPTASLSAQLASDRACSGASCP